MSESDTPWADMKTQYPTGKPSEAYISLKDARRFERDVNSVLKELNTRNTRMKSALEKIAFCKQDCSDKDAVMFMRDFALMGLAIEDVNEQL